MATLQLTQGKVAIIDDEDLERCLAYKWYANKMANRPQAWYAVTTVRLPDGRETKLYLHRFLLGLPKGVKGDHVDGNPLNCRRVNLRRATTRQNGANRLKQHKIATSQFKGVSRQKPGKKYRNPKWRATITIHGRLIQIGLFTSEIEAAQAYDCAAVLHFGAFANLNFGRASTLSTSLVGAT